MGAPRGEVRRAVVGAIQAGPCTLGDVVSRTQLEYAQVKAALQNGLRSGELTITGQEKRPHAKRWLAIYELARPPGEEPQKFETENNFADLIQAVYCWNR